MSSWQYKLRQGDCLEVMRSMPDKCVDLVMGSPPYADVREYSELEFSLKGQEWVDWMLLRIREMVRLCRGLVAMVISDPVVNFQWTGEVALLMADMLRAGFYMRRPPLYVREGIPGSGGKDWFKNKYEIVVCCTAKPGKLPWHDNTACGKPCGYPVGGSPSHRNKQGLRAGGMRRKNGKRRLHGYTAPKLANPGNLIMCGADTHLGAGNLGEAPYPKKVPAFFIRSCCPPGGIVFDPFCGTSTTGVAALEAGRRFIGVDLRQSQIDISRQRLTSMKKSFGF